MIFTLIKNELIKISRRAKTWAVIILFSLFIGITIFSHYQSDKNMRRWNSPEYQLENLNNELTYLKDEYEYYDSDEYIKSRENEILELQKEGILTEEEINNEKELIKTRAEQEKNHITNRYKETEKSKKELEDLVNGGNFYENFANLELEQRIEAVQESINYLKSDESKVEGIDFSIDIEIAEDELEYYKKLQSEGKPLIEEWEYEKYNYFKFISMILAMGILACLISIFMSDIVSGECTPATFKFLLIQPVSKGKILFSKFISVTTVVLVSILGIELVGVLFVNLTSKLNTGNNPIKVGMKFTKKVLENGYPILEKITDGYIISNSELFIKSIMFQALFIITTCSVVFMISTLIKSSMITMTISVMVIICITISSQVMPIVQEKSHLFFTTYADLMSVYSGRATMLTQNVKITVQCGIVVMIITAIIAYLISYINFKRKDFKI